MIFEIIALGLMLKYYGDIYDYYNIRGIVIV